MLQWSNLSFNDHKFKLEVRIHTGAAGACWVFSIRHYEHILMLDCLQGGSWNEFNVILRKFTHILRKFTWMYVNLRDFT